MAGGAAAATSAAVTGLGFTSSGIAAGSAAAGVQAVVGNVAAGSLFATVQSLGATGVIATLGIAGGVGLGIGGLAYLVYRVAKKINEDN